MFCPVHRPIQRAGQFLGGGQGLAPFEADPICPTLKDREGPPDGFPAGRGKSGSFLSQGSHICKELERMCPYALRISLYFFRIRKRPQTALTGVLPSHHSRLAFLPILLFLSGREASTPFPHHLLMAPSAPRTSWPALCSIPAHDLHAAVRQSP